MTLQEQIADAELKLHALQTGSMARTITDQNGEKVEFTAANRGDLLAYINRLKGQLPGESCSPGPISFLF